MNRIISLFVAGCLMIGAFSIIGCEAPNQSDLPSNENGTTAGGNGAFGENPSRPGDYNTNGSGSSNSPVQSSSHNY